MYKKKLQNEATNAFPYSWPLLSVCLTFPSPSPTNLFVTLRSIPSIPMAVLYGLPGSPGADSIPFPAAIVLSVIVFIGAVIRLGGYFLPRSNQPLQLIVSVFSLAASGLLLGLVSSRNGKSNYPHLWMSKLNRLGSHWCQIVYVCLLIVNIGIVGIYEVYSLNKRHISCANTLIGGILLANPDDRFPAA